MISKIIEKNGNKFIEINGNLYPPAAFRSFRPTPANISQFYNNGVRLFQMIVSGLVNCNGVKYSLFGEVWQGDEVYDFSTFDKQMEMFMNFAPEGYFCVMIQLDTRQWFLEKYGCPDSFRELGQACFYEEWKQAAAKYLKAFVEYAEEKYGDRIFAYSFSAGAATEWFVYDAGVYNERREIAFQKYMQCESTCLPTEEELNSLSQEFLREKESLIPDYYIFTGENIAKTICFFAQKIQEVLEHRKLVGLFYGYLMPLSGKITRWGLTKYEPVWKNPNIDMIFAPAAYREFRGTENAAAYQVAVDSLTCCNKLYMHEIDHRTHLAQYPLENGMILPDAYKTEEESVMILRRELCQALQKGTALWWFDFYGGYYFSKRYDHEINRAMEIINTITAFPRKSISEVAVFYDSESIAYLNENHRIKEDYVNHMIMEIAKSGVLYDIYNQNDLLRIDTSQYKVLVFLDAFKISKEIVKAAEKSEAYKVWIHAPGYATNHEKCDIEDIVGMQLEETECGKAVHNGAVFGFSKDIRPVYEILNGTEKLAYFENSNKAAVAVKERNIYSALGNIPYTLWQQIERLAGVHIYTDNGIAVYGDSRFLCVQNPFSEECSIYLTEEKQFVEAFDGGEYQSRECVLKYDAPKGTTKMFVNKELYKE